MQTLRDSLVDLYVIEWRIEETPSALANVAAFVLICEELTS